jgi:hypothetical protein
VGEDAGPDDGDKLDRVSDREKLDRESNLQPKYLLGQAPPFL